MNSYFNQLQTKETLSVNHEADFQIQNLDGSFDLTGTLSNLLSFFIDFVGSFKRETFEKVSEDLFATIIPAIERLLEQGGLTKKDIDLIELVGGSSRIPKGNEPFCKVGLLIGH